MYIVQGTKYKKTVSPHTQKDLKYGGASDTRQIIIGFTKS